MLKRMYRHLFPSSPFLDFFEKIGGKLSFSSGISNVAGSLILTSDNSNTGFSFFFFLTLGFQGQGQFTACP